MQDDECLRLVKAVAANFPHLVSRGDYDPEPTYDLWMMMFGNVEYTVFKAAVLEILKAAKFFPTVAEIQGTLDRMKQIADGVPSAEEGWEWVRKNLNYYQYPKSFPHPLVEKIVKIMGWRELCCSENPSIDRAQFIKYYNNVEKTEAERESTKETFKRLGISVAELVPSVNATLGYTR